MSSRWTTPIAHCAGGGDNVLVVEDGYLTTKAISRWKRDANGKSSRPPSLNFIQKYTAVRRTLQQEASES
jgi:hypothetical protein